MAPNLDARTIKLQPLSGSNTRNYVGSWKGDNGTEAGMFIQVAYAGPLTVWRQPVQPMQGATFAKTWSRFRQASIEELGGQRTLEDGQSTIRYVYFNVGDLRCVGLRHNLSAHRGGSVTYVFNDRYYCGRGREIWDENFLRPIAVNYQIEAIPRPPSAAGGPAPAR